MTRLIPQTFPIRIGPRSRLFLRVFFGVREDTAFVTLDDDLDARFGWYRLRTPMSNVVSWRIEGPWLWITAIGMRTSIRHRDVTFGGNQRGGVRIDFKEPVRFLFYHVPALYVTVADLEGLAAALRERGFDGVDARTGVAASGS